MPAGRPRKPTTLKLVTGTEKPCRANPAEPQPPPAPTGMAPPRHLSPRAVDAWHRLAPMLDAMGVLTVADELALERLCECYAELEEARASLARPVLASGKDGEPVEIAAAGQVTYVTHSANGSMVRARPEVAAIAEADRRLKGYLAEFGLTPSTRSRVKAEGGGERDPLDAYFAD